MTTLHPAQLARPLRRMIALLLVAGLALAAPSLAHADASSSPAAPAPTTLTVVSPDAGSWSTPNDASTTTDPADSSDAGSAVAPIQSDYAGSWS